MSRQRQTKLRNTDNKNNRNKRWRKTANGSRNAILYRHPRQRQGKGNKMSLSKTTKNCRKHDYFFVDFEERLIATTTFERCDFDRAKDCSFSRINIQRCRPQGRQEKGGEISITYRGAGCERREQSARSRGSCWACQAWCPGSPSWTCCTSPSQSGRQTSPFPAHWRLAKHRDRQCSGSDPNPDPDPPDPHALGLMDPDPDQLVRGMDPDPDPSIIKHK